MRVARRVAIGVALAVVVAAAVVGCRLAQETQEASWPVPLATPAGLSCTKWTSVDVPKSIPDNDAGGVTSTVTVTDTAYIGWISAVMVISHTYVSDLQVDLISPSGTTVTLLAEVDGSGNHFIDTLLHDDAGQDIDDAEAWQAPFTGTWLPSEALSAVYNEAANGTWTLWLVDDGALDEGTLLYWDLNICTNVATMTPTYTPSPTPTPSQTPTPSSTPTTSPTPTMDPDECLSSLQVRLVSSAPGADPCGTPGAPAGTAQPWVGRSVMLSDAGLHEMGTMIVLCPQAVPVAGATPAAYYPTPMWHLSAEFWQVVQGGGTSGGTYSSLCPATPHPWPTTAASGDCWAQPTEEVSGNCGVPWKVWRKRNDRFSGLYGANSTGYELFGGYGIGCDSITDACGVAGYCEQYVEISLPLLGCYFAGDETPVPTAYPTMTPYTTPATATLTPTNTPVPSNTPTPTQGPWISEVLARPVPTGTPCTDWNLRSGCGADDSFVEIGVPSAVALPDWWLAVHDGDDDLTCKYTYRSDNYNWPLKTVWLDQPFVQSNEDKICEAFPITGTVYLYNESDEVMDTRAYTGTTYGSSWCALDWEDPTGTWAVCTPSPGKD